MEIKTLRYFLAVAREENMTRASETLHVTQPTLSKQLKALEEELGKKLFTRHAFSIKLTDEGVLLRNRAEDIRSKGNSSLSTISREVICISDLPNPTRSDFLPGRSAHLRRNIPGFSIISPAVIRSRSQRSWTRGSWISSFSARSPIRQSMSRLCSRSRMSGAS